MSRVAGVLISAALLLVADAPALTKQDADRFQAKLTKIVDFGNAKPAAKAPKPQSISVSDAEVNSYLRFIAAPQIPGGIVEPVLNAMGDGRVSGRAIVDLDAVRKQKQRGWMDPLAYLGGQLPVTAAGRLATKDGKGQFQLDGKVV